MINLSLRYCELKKIPISAVRLVHVMNAVVIVTGENSNLSMLFVVSRFLSAKVSSKWRLNPGLWSQNLCPFPLSL